MSSSINYEKCPQCGGVYVIELDCSTLEEYCFCNRCGKANNFVIARNKDGNAIIEDEDCGITKYINESSDGYGCLAIAEVNGVRTIYHYDHPVNVEQIKNEYLNILNEGEGCMSIKRDTNADLMKGVLKLVKENGWYDEANGIMDYFLPESRCVRELTNYEFDFKAIVKYGRSEGIYLDCYLEGSFDGSNLDDNMTTIPCGTFKTLGDSLRHTRIMGELAGSLTYYARQYLSQNFSGYCLITNN